MSNKYDHLFNPDWPEIKINDAYFREVDAVRNSPDDLEELRQAFHNASDEHIRRINELEETKNVLISG